MKLDMGPISGGQSGTATWILRGDEEGDYIIQADVIGTLEPFSIPVSFAAETTDPLRVWGGSALRMVVDVEDSVWADYPYRVRVGLVNS